MPRKPRYPLMEESPDQLKRAVAEFVARRLYLRGWTQIEAASRLGTSQANISRVMCRQINRLTFNQLFRYLVSLEPHARIMLSDR